MRLLNAASLSMTPERYKTMGINTPINVKENRFVISSITIVKSKMSVTDALNGMLSFLVNSYY